MLRQVEQEAEEQRQIVGGMRGSLAELSGQTYVDGYNIVFDYEQFIAIKLLKA